MDRQFRMDYQALVTSTGWERFRRSVLIDTEENGKVRKCLRSQTQDKLNACARAGDWEKTAYYTGQLDILEVVLNLPNKEITKSPNPFTGRGDRVTGGRNEL